MSDTKTPQDWMDRESAEEYPDDWLNNVIDVAIALPYQFWEEGEKPEAIWSAFEGYCGTFLDTDLSENDPGARAFQLADQLQGLTAEQYKAIAALLFLAVKATRKVCENVPE